MVSKDLYGSPQNKRYHGFGPQCPRGIKRTTSHRYFRPLSSLDAKVDGTEITKDSTSKIPVVQDCQEEFLWSHHEVLGKSKKIGGKRCRSDKRDFFIPVPSRQGETV